MLTYLKDSKKSNNCRLYKCRCNYCNKIIYVRKHRINRQKSCGCQRSTNLDLTNKKFNFITYTGEERRNKFRSIIHKGICDCGNEVWSTSQDYSKKIACGCNLSYSKRPVRIYGKKGKYIHHAILAHFMSGARVRDIPFNLTLKDLDKQYVKQKGLCYYTGLKLILPNTANDFNKGRNNNISIDRIDPKKDYSPKNICFCLKEINLMKFALQKEEFIKLCKLVAKHNKTKRRG